jgi:hypothetical protein
MTGRAVILGLFSAIVVCVATIVNNHIIHQTHLVGHQMPVFVFGMLVLFVALINPLLWRWGPKRALSGQELAVVVAMTMAACVVPQSGFLRYFTPVVMLPHHYERTEPGWKSAGVVDMVPKRMLAGVTAENREEVLGGFLKGMARPDDQEHIRVTDVPWSAWLYTLVFWSPLLISIWIGLIGLAVVVHRQWSEHEQLAYPIAAFASALLPDKGNSVGHVFRQRLFRIGLFGVLGIHLLNYLHAWFPDQTLSLPRRFDFTAVLELFPTFARGPNFHLVRPNIYFAVIAFAYFLASDVALSLAIGPFLFAFVTGLFLTYGISLHGGGLNPSLQTYIQFGACMAMFIGLVVMGRHYYLRVFRRAVGLSVKEDPGITAVWGARVCLLGLAGFVGMLCLVGVDWQIAILYGVLIMILYVVLSRVVAETGFFHPESRWFPCVVLMGFLGPKALNPNTYVILLLLSIILAWTPREALMPYMVNALKLLDLRRVKIGRTAIWCAVTLVIALATSLALTLYIEYDKGMNIGDSGTVQGISKIAFHGTIRFQQRLIAQDLLEEANAISGWGRFAQMMPQGRYLVAFGAGLALVGAFTLLRIRFARWPLHPVLFITWNSVMGQHMAISFLIGWGIKSLVTKYGGPGKYLHFKPLMIGLIAGDLVGSVIPFLIGSFFRIVTDWPIAHFNTMPG